MEIGKWRQAKHGCSTVNVLLIFIWCSKRLLLLIYQVAAIKGMFLANRKLENQVKTYITYNRGRDWRLLQAPSQDLKGNSIHCVLVSVSQHAPFTPFVACLYHHERTALTGNEWSTKLWRSFFRHSYVCQSALRQLLWKVSHWRLVSWPLI